MSGMRSLRLHFILGYGTVGAIGPFIPEFFRADRNLNPQQIGQAFALAQACIMISPVVLTLLADRWMKPKSVAIGIYLLAATAVLGLWATQSFSAVLVFFTAFSFAFAALFPTQDGLYFALQSQRAATALPSPPYHRIRVLGTLGFIVPSLVLLILIPPGGSLAIILPTAAIFAVAAALNATTLPDPRVKSAEMAGTRLPTVDAARNLFSSSRLRFCIAMFLLQFAHAGYYAFYPIHLVQVLGVEQRWLGAISTLGVACEGAMMFAFGWIAARIGIRRLLAFGAAATALRLAILVFADDAAPAVLANILHGPIILGTLVAPVLFINQFAGDTYRNSMQGVFAVAIIGPARILGNLLSGRLSTYDTRWTFAVGAVLALAATVLILGLVARPSPLPQTTPKGP